MKNFKNIRNENINKMKLIDKMKKASPAAKKALEAPSRVEDVRSADKKAETYIKPDGKAGIRMVPVDKTVMKKEEVELDEAPRRKGAPKMTGDSVAIQRAKDAAHNAAMGRTKTGRKKPIRTMTSTQKSLASMRREAVEPLDEASKEGTIKIIKTKDNKFQVQRMTKGKFVNQGKPYKSQKEAEKVRNSGQHSMQFEETALNELTAAEKKLINQMYDKKGNLTPMGKKVMDHGKANSKLTPQNRAADNARRKEYKAYQMKKGITPFVPHPDKVKEENLNELSPEVRQSYRKKAMANRNKADLDRTMGLMNRAKGKGRSTEKDIKKADDTLAKRNRGQALFNKQKAKNLPKSSNIIKASKDQEVETQTQESNLNELSPKTMGRYVGAASTSLKTAAQKSGSGSYATQAARRNRYKDLKTATKRKRGIDTAVNKLVKSEAVNELSLIHI